MEKGSDQLFMTECDAAFIQIIGRHLHGHFISLSDSNMKLPHLTRKVGKYTMAIGELHTEHPIRENLFNGSVYLYLVGFWHNCFKFGSVFSKNGPTEKPIESI